MRRTHVLVIAAAASALAVAASSCGGGGGTAPKPAPEIQSLVPPLSDAQAGEWLRLEAGADAEVYRVVGADDTEVRIEGTKYHNGIPSESPTVFTWSRNSFGIPPEGVIRRIAPDHIEAGGRFRDCWRLEVHSRMGVFWYWVTDEVPVHGVLRWARVSKGVPEANHTVDLADSGFGEAK